MMKPQAIEWSKPKQDALATQLNGYWAEDVWDATKCPLGQVDNLKYKTKFIHFDKLSPPLRVELKYACWQKIERKDWGINTLWQTSTGVTRIIDWLTVCGVGVSSLLDRSLEYWEMSFRTYMVEKGLWKVKTAKQLNRDQEIQQYQRIHPAIHALRQIYKILQEAYDDRSEHEKDVWDLRKMGAKLNPSRSTYFLNFTQISQPWLQVAVKQFCKYTLAVFSPAETSNRLYSLKVFSNFLKATHPSLQPSEIDRALILEYAHHMVIDERPNNARIRLLSHLRTFLELCAREQWLDVPDKRLIYSEDFPKHEKAQPRFVPEEVMRQLNQHLDDLPPYIKRMTLIIQEVGMRIGELCRCPFDCLMQDAQGDFFIRYYQYKMKKEHSVPISRELAAVIQEQQQAVREDYGQMTFLFPSPSNWHKGEPIRQWSFAQKLNALAYEKDIRDDSGKLWRFQAHQFRHTVGTRMINLGVPQHIIQRYLGHESPGMTSVYAHIHDQTLKDEFAKFKRKIVDVTGKVIIPEATPEDTPEFQWFKRNVLAQALPNGSCALPIVTGECPHANACLTCAHFRTDTRYLPEHKKQLEQTNRVIDTATANGWNRQVEMNQRVKTNLEKIIASLEEDDHETGT